MEYMKKIGAGLLIAAIAAFALILLYPELQLQLMIASAILSITGMIATSEYYRRTEVHDFIILDENGQIKDVVRKRLRKTIERTMKVDIEGQEFEINPQRKSHVISNFYSEELEIKTDEAKVSAVVRETDRSAIDILIQSIKMLITRPDYILILLLITMALSGASMLFSIMIYTNVQKLVGS